MDFIVVARRGVVGELMQAYARAIASASVPRRTRRLEGINPERHDVSYATTEASRT